MFEEFIQQAMEHDAQMVERACEEALQLGDRGVLEVHYQGRIISIGPHSKVPYGYRYVVPHEGLEAFLAR